MIAKLLNVMLFTFVQKYFCCRMASTNEFSWTCGNTQPDGSVCTNILKPGNKFCSECGVRVIQPVDQQTTTDAIITVDTAKPEDLSELEIEQRDEDRSKRSLSSSVDQLNLANEESGEKTVGMTEVVVCHGDNSQTLHFGNAALKQTDESSASAQKEVTLLNQSIADTTCSTADGQISERFSIDGDVSDETSQTKSNVPDDICHKQTTVDSQSDTEQTQTNYDAICRAAAPSYMSDEAGHVAELHLTEVFESNSSQSATDHSASAAIADVSRAVSENNDRRNDELHVATEEEDLRDDHLDSPADTALKGDDYSVRDDHEHARQTEDDGTLSWNVEPGETFSTDKSREGLTETHAPLELQTANSEVVDEATTLQIITNVSSQTGMMLEVKSQVADVDLTSDPPKYLIATGDAATGADTYLLEDTSAEDVMHVRGTAYSSTYIQNDIHVQVTLYLTLKPDYLLSHYLNYGFGEDPHQSL